MSSIIRLLSLLALLLLAASGSQGTPLAPNPNPGLIVVAPSDRGENFVNFLNQGTIQVEGFLENTGVLDNEGTISTVGSGYIRNYGSTLIRSGSTLSGVFENYVDLQVSGTAQLTGYSEYGTTEILPGGSLELAPTYHTLGGNLIVGGTAHNPAGSFFLTQYPSLLSTVAGGEFVNDGTFQDDGFGHVSNAGTFRNNAGATIDAGFTNEVGGLVINDGDWAVRDFVNHGDMRLTTFGGTLGHRQLRDITNSSTGVIDIDLNYAEFAGIIHNDGLIRVAGELLMQPTGIPPQFTQGVGGELQVAGRMFWDIPDALSGKITGGPGASLTLGPFDPHVVAQGAQVDFDIVTSDRELTNKGALRARSFYAPRFSSFRNEGVFEGGVYLSDQGSVSNTGQFIVTHTLSGSDATVFDNLSGGTLELRYNNEDFGAMLTNDGRVFSQSSANFTGVNRGVIDHDFGQLNLDQFEQSGQLMIGPSGGAQISNSTTTTSSLIENRGWLDFTTDHIGSGTLRQISGRTVAYAAFAQDLIELQGGRLEIITDFVLAPDDRLSIQLQPTTAGLLKVRGQASLLGTIDILAPSVGSLTPGLEWFVIEGASLDLSQATIQLADLSSQGLSLIAEVITQSGGFDTLRIRVAVPEVQLAGLLALALGLLTTIRRKGSRSN